MKDLVVSLGQTSTGHLRMVIRVYSEANTCKPADGPGCLGNRTLHLGK
jgi:hypothetical protein